MRRNHISGKMKRILAVACAAAVVFTSVPGGSFAYADEVTNEQEAGLSETAEENTEAADAATTENAAETEEQVSTEESSTAETESAQEQKEETPAQEEVPSQEEAPAKEEAPAQEEAPASDTSEAAEPAKTDKVEEEKQAPADQGKETVQESKPAEKADDASGETAPKTDTNKDNADEKKAPTVKKTTPAKKTEPKEAMKAGPDVTAPVVKEVKLSSDGKSIEVKIEEENPSEEGWSYSYKKEGQEDRITGSSKENEFSITPSGDGTYTDFQIEGKDASDNSLTFAEGVEDDLADLSPMIVDGTAPKVTKAEKSEDGKSISVTIEEEHPSTDGWSYSYKKKGQEAAIKGTSTENSFSITPDGDGTYSEFQISGKDKYNNDLVFAEGVQQDLANLSPMIIDTAAPVVTNVSQPEDKKSVSITITEANISDNGWTLSYTYTKKGSSETKSQTFNSNSISFAPTDEGIYTNFAITGKDAAGKDLTFNTGLQAALAGKEIVIDKTAPEITLTSVKEGEQGDQKDKNVAFGKNSLTYTFSVDENVDEMQNVTIKYLVSDTAVDISSPKTMDVSSWEDASGETSFSVDADKEGYVYIYAADTQGNAAAIDCKALVVEDNAPTLTLTKLQPELKFNNTIQFTASDSATHVSGLQKITYTLTGKNGKEITSGSITNDRPESLDGINSIKTKTGTLAIDAATLKLKGKVTIKAKAIDWCGNESGEQTMVVYYDTDAPDIDIDGTAEFATDVGDKLVTNKKGEITVVLTDQGEQGDPTHNLTGTVKLNDYEDQMQGASPVSKPYSMTTLGLTEDGSYELNVTVKDDTNNENTGTFAFELDNTKPTSAYEIVTTGAQDDDDFKVFNAAAVAATEEKGVTVKFTLTDAHSIYEGTEGATPPTLTYKEDGVVVPNAKLTRVNNKEYTITLTKDADYTDFTVNGTDIVKNPIDNAALSGLKIRIDTAGPKLVSITSDAESQKDFLKGEGEALYYVSSEKVTDTYVIEDDYLKAKDSTAKFEVNYSIDGTAVSTPVAAVIDDTGKKATVTVEMSGEGIYSDFVLTGKDAFGNPIEISDSFSSNPVADLNAVTGGKGTITLTNGKVIDITAPVLTEVSSGDAADKFNNGSDGYFYASVETVTDTYTISDVNLGKTTVTYSGKGETLTETGTDKIQVTMSGDGVYKDFTVTGADKAGNAIIVADALGKGTVNEVLVPAAGKPIRLTYGKVLDTEAPVLASVTSSVASGKKFYDGKDGLWYVSSNTVTDTYTITDADPGTTALGTTTLSTTTVSYTDKGTAKKATGTSKITVKMSGDGVYKGFTVTGADKAGNKIITEQKLNDGKVNEVPKAASPIKLTYGKVLDVTAPTVKFTTTKRSYADSLEGSRRYFRDTFTGTFTVVDNFTLDNSKISSHIYRAGDSVKYYNKQKVFKEESVIDPDKDQAKKITYVGEVTADGGHSADGNYRFFIEGTDKAGNKIVVDKAQPASGEFALLDSSSGKGTGFRSNDKVLDTVAPRAVMKVVNDKDKSFYTLDMSPSNYKLSDFDPYQKKIASTVKITTDDKSPVDIAYDIVSTVNEGNKPGRYAGYGNDAGSTTGIPARRQIITINDLVIRDRAGNILALSGDPNNENVSATEKETLYLSNKLIFDDKAPTTPNDIVAPSATVIASGSITHRNADGRDLFNGARTLTVTITDEGGATYSSGLKNVSYDVYVDGKKVAGDAKTYSEIGASKALNEKTANIKNDSLTYTKKFSIRLTESYQSNDIEVRVNAEDHSGNKMQTVKYRCGIDSVGPKITVSYDNNSAQNEKYFKADRTATITVIDRNVDNSKIPIRTEVSVPGSFSWSSGGGNGADDRWVKTLGYNTDGDYTLQLGDCTDALGNKASVTYEGVAPNAFTIDKTIPVISVTFDNNSFQNGKYYKDPRTATVTIQEHNFRGSDVQISQTGDAASAGGFNEGGDSHSATIYYGTDGDYAFNVNYTDLAGNPAQVVTVDEFTVDLTPPVVRFIEPDENKINKSGLIAYTGDIAPEIFYSDKNITKGMAVITLNGAKANHSLDPVEDLFDGFEGTVRFGNLAKVRENDDIYTAIATVTDLAGNETPVTVVFSVNRFGSTFDYNKNEYTEGMIKSYYTNDAKDMILREINVNELESYTVTLYRDGENRKLVEGTDFKVEKKEVNGHYEYIYTIFASNFTEEGNYNVVVTSKDKAGNTNTNSSVRGDDGSNEVPLRFAVDKTAPTNLITGVDLTKDRFRESGLNLSIQPMDNMNAVASFHVRVTDSDGKVLFEQILTDKELAAFFQDQNGIYNLPIEQNTKWQTVEVVTTDAAGNVSTDYTVENNTAYNVLVTPNVFYQYINSKPMLGGTAALIALLIFLIAMKRKKDNDQAAA